MVSIKGTTFLSLSYIPISLNAIYNMSKQIWGSVLSLVRINLL